MFLESLNYLVRNIASFFILNLLLRFYLQLAHASFAHPLAQFTVKLTNFIVLPARRLIPSVSGYDSATIVLAWLAGFCMHVLLIVLSPYAGLMLTPTGCIEIARLALVTVVELSLILLFGAVIVQAALSWVNPYNPLTPILDALTRPFLGPIRRVVPVMAGLDLSPWVLILVLGLMLRLLGPYDGAMVGI